MEPKTTTIISVLFSIAPLLSLTTIAASSKIQAIFGFGDSTADTGNNNFLLTTTLSNFQPYGRDFPNQEPTGRFSNGKLPIDLLASKNGIKELIPPYLNRSLSNDQELLSGVSFASSGSGLDPLIAERVSNNALTLPTQIGLFNKALLKMKKLVGEKKAKYIVETALYIVAIGANDFANFYNLDERSMQFNISGYQDFVLMKLEDAIKRLYKIGARRIVVIGLPPIGCLPAQITALVGFTEINRTCIQNQNNDSIIYNQKLQALISKLVADLPNFKVLYFDAYSPLLDAINQPAKYGFEVVSRGCCGTGLFEYGDTCREPIETCADPSKYVFWDAVHPTLAFYEINAEQLFTLLSSF